MSLLDWNSPDERAAYFRKKGSEYRKSHPRLTLTFSEEEFKWVEGSANHYGIEKVLGYTQLARRHQRFWGVCAAMFIVVTIVSIFIDTSFVKWLFLRPE